MNIVPSFLRDIAFCVQQKKKSVTFNIRCTCANTKFRLYKSFYDEYELQKIKSWEQLLKKYNGGGFSDKEGNIYLRTKGFLCFYSKIKLDKSMIPSYDKGIKIKCSMCGNEYTIFDSRLNGYDAVTEMPTGNNCSLRELNYKPRKFGKNYDPVDVKITIRNDLTYDEFIEDIGEELSEEDYSNAFSSIDIYAERDNKKGKIFSSETA